MNNSLKYFAKLYDERRELALLAWAYLVIGVGSVIVAGVFALFNQELGQAILVVPFVAMIALCMNVVAWALIKLAADTFLTKKSTAKKNK